MRGMMFYAETFALSVVAGAVYAASWWASGKLGIGDSHITVASLGFAFAWGLGTGLVIGRQRVVRAFRSSSKAGPS